MQVFREILIYISQKILNNAKWAEGRSKMTVMQWYEVSVEITRESEKRKRTGKPRAKEDAIISAMKKYGLLYVELEPGGNIWGLIEKAGSRWALLVGVSSNRQRVLTHVIGSLEGNNWTPEELQAIYRETVSKRRGSINEETDRFYDDPSAVCGDSRYSGGAVLPSRLQYRRRSAE